MKRNLERIRKDTIVAEEVEQPALPARVQNVNGFFTFRYSSTEVFSQDDKLHVKMRQTRYEDGRLSSEECEGTLNRDACTQWAPAFSWLLRNFTRGW